MGTKNNPGRFDCYNAAGDDEPMFVLLARDPMAPDVIRYWAMWRELNGESSDKVDEARACARAMEDWRS